jgi:hypothetical protein
MNTYVALEKTYPGAEVMPDAIELARQLAGALKTTVERSIPLQKVFKTERDKDMAAAGPAQRAEMIAGAKKQQDAEDAAVKDADSVGKWAPFMKNNEKSLTALQARADRESTRLAGLPVDKMRQSLVLTRTAKQNLAGGDVDGAAAALKEASSLWSVNEMASRLDKEVKAQKAAKSAEAAAPVATPVRTTPKPTTPRPSAALQSAAAAAPTAQVEEDKPFIMTLPGAISVVVGLAVVLGGANIFMKMKKRKAEQPQ